MRIAEVEVHAVGEAHEWNFYSDSDQVPLRSTLTICRVRTECGLEVLSRNYPLLYAASCCLILGAAV